MMRAFIAFIVWGLLMPTVVIGFFSRLVFSGFREGMSIFDHMMQTVREDVDDDC